VGTVRTWKTFLAVAKHGSFAAAGKEVGLTSAAVGLQMRALESELNQQLFDRSARAVVLNTAGRKTVPMIKDLLVRYESLGVGGDPDEPMGTVAVGALVSALMGSFADALWNIRKQYPKLEVRLRAGMSADFTRQVERGELDAAVVIQSPHPLPANLIWTPLYSEPMVLVVPRKPHFDMPSDGSQMLSQCPFIRFDPSTWSGYLVREVLRQCKVTPKEAMELNSFEAIIEIVRQGFGIAIVPKLANVDWTRDQGLRIVSLSGVKVKRSVGLLERANHARSDFTLALKKYFSTKKDRSIS